MSEPGMLGNVTILPHCKILRFGLDSICQGKLFALIGTLGKNILQKKTEKVTFFSPSTGTYMIHPG